MAEQDHDIRLIVGLGNPGAEYQETRHNIGFLVADTLIKRLLGEVGFKSKYHGKYVDKNIFGRRIFFLKPQSLCVENNRLLTQFTSFVKEQKLLKFNCYNYIS